MYSRNIECKVGPLNVQQDQLEGITQFTICYVALQTNVPIDFSRTISSLTLGLKTLYVAFNISNSPKQVEYLSTQPERPDRYIGCCKINHEQFWLSLAAEHCLVHVYVGLRGGGCRLNMLSSDAFPSGVLLARVAKKKDGMRILIKFLGHHVPMTI